MTPAEAKALIAALPRAVVARVAPTFDDAASLVAAEARRLLGAQRHTGSRRRLGPTAGTLADSISSGRDPEIGGAVVTVSAPYAADVEFGTSRMAARPFLRPAAEGALPDIRDRLATIFAQAVADTLDTP